MSIVDDLQFGRVIEVDIKNFKTNQKISIGNEFKIEFTFYKTIDEVNEASVGNVKIYGLTEETRKSLGGSGGELTLRCGYLNSEVKTLFIADIVKIAPEYGSSESIVNIDVSANFMDYAFSKTANFGTKEISIFDRAVGLANDEKRYVEFNLSNINEQDIQSVTEWIQTAKSRVAFAYNQKQDLDNFCDTYGFTFSREVGVSNEETDDTDKYLKFYVPANKAHIITQWSYGSYQKVKQEISQKDITDEKNFKNIFVTDESEAIKQAFVFSKETGMIGYPRLQEKIVEVPENWKVRSNEEATQESLNTVANKKQAIAAKQAKRKAEGKKPLKVKPKNYTIKVNRKFVTVTAQINPDVKPQSHVKIISLIEEANGIYRVRSIRYTGNNRDGSFVMEMDCEDSTGSKDFALTKQQIKDEQNSTLDIDASGVETSSENIGSDNGVITEDGG